MLAPKALGPFEEPPTPLCICMLLTEDAKSGRFTKKVPMLSASLYATPLMVTLILVASVPLILMPV